MKWESQTVAAIGKAAWSNLKETVSESGINNFNTKALGGLGTLLLKGIAKTALNATTDTA